MPFPFIRPLNIHPSVQSGDTPNSVDWSDITFDDFSSKGLITSQQITGIAGSINIEIQPGTGSAPTLYYQISASQVTGEVSGSPSSPWISVTSNTTVAVSNNEWLSFVCYGFGFGSRNATIVNKSDGDTTLDTFTYYIVTS
jgi:hypothetical protein